MKEASKARNVTVEEHDGDDTNPQGLSHPQDCHEFLSNATRVLIRVLDGHAAGTLGLKTRCSAEIELSQQQNCVTAKKDQFSTHTVIVTLWSYTMVRAGRRHSIVKSAATATSSQGSIFGSGTLYDGTKRVKRTCGYASCQRGERRDGGVSGQKLRKLLRRFPSLSTAGNA